MPATSARARSGRTVDDATVKVTFSVGTCTTAVQVAPGAGRAAALDRRPSTSYVDAAREVRAPAGRR